MSLVASTPLADLAAQNEVSDEEIVERVRCGELAAYEILMRRYNQRLFRVAVSILRDDAEAEDVMQETYFRAFRSLSQFAGLAKFSTWLTKIAVHEALSRLRRRQRMEIEPVTDKNSLTMDNVTTGTPDPERQAHGSELRDVLEAAITALPDLYRSVFVLRAVEGLSAAETAACLDIGEEAVKTRLHRARQMLRKDLRHRANILTAETFPFHLSRCDRVVAAVFQRIRAVS